MSSLSFLESALRRLSAHPSASNSPAAPAPTARPRATRCGRRRRTREPQSHWPYVPRRKSGPDLIKALVPVAAIEGQPWQRVGDSRPVTGQQLDHFRVLTSRSRDRVSRSMRKVPIRVGDHRRAAAEHHIAGDQPADPIRAGQQQRTGVAGVTGVSKTSRLDMPTMIRSPSSSPSGPIRKCGSAARTPSHPARRASLRLRSDRDAGG